MNTILHRPLGFGRRALHEKQTTASVHPTARRRSRPSYVCWRAALVSHGGVFTCLHTERVCADPFNQNRTRVLMKHHAAATLLPEPIGCSYRKSWHRLATDLVLLTLIEKARGCAFGRVSHLPPTVFPKQMHAAGPALSHSENTNANRTAKPELIPVSIRLSNETAILVSSQTNYFRFV
jgi:hypothetical protein